MSPLQEPRNLKPQSPRCSSLHLSTAPALALGGHPCSPGSTARTAGQDRDCLLVAQEAHTHSYPVSSCKAETGQEVWNPQLSRWPECNMPLSQPDLEDALPPQSCLSFTNESTLCMRWPKYWSFSLSISPSNEYPGLVSFRMD